MTAKTRPDSTAEIGEIERLLEPWLHFEMASGQYLGMLGTCAPYEFDTIVKFDTAPADPSGFRAELLSRAEKALTALSEAGWQLTSYPSMDFDGAIVHQFIQAFGAKLVKPAEQGMIRLRMRFAVNRPR